MKHTPTDPGPPGTKFQVIGAGFCRTGTKTFNEALTILLGGPVHDAGIQSLGGSWHQIRRWLEIMQLAPKASTVTEKKYLEYCLADILDGYVATVDAPAISLTPELMSVFPDAIVIATTRDKESWWKSMTFMNGIMDNWWLGIMLLWLPKVQVYNKWRTELGHLGYWRYGENWIHEGTLQKHEDHLRAVVPEEKLFWYNVKDGWEPLCKMLNVPVPNVPFPHNNSREDADKSHKEVLFMCVLSWLMALSFFIGLIWVLKAYVPRPNIGGLSSVFRHQSLKF